MTTEEIIRKNSRETYATTYNLFGERSNFAEVWIERAKAFNSSYRYLVQWDIGSRFCEPEKCFRTEETARLFITQVIPSRWFYSEWALLSKLDSEGGSMTILDVFLFNSSGGVSEDDIQMRTEEL